MDLELSNAQKVIFAGWRRLLDTHGSVDGPANEPDLVQDITTDCSVVASLCAGVARAKKGHAKVIYSIHFFSQFIFAKIRPSSSPLPFSHTTESMTCLASRRPENTYFA